MRRMADIGADERIGTCSRPEPVLPRHDRDKVARLRASVSDFRRGKNARDLFDERADGQRGVGLANCIVSGGTGHEIARMR